MIYLSVFYLCFWFFLCFFDLTRKNGELLVILFTVRCLELLVFTFCFGSAWDFPTHFLLIDHHEMKLYLQFVSFSLIYMLCFSSPSPLFLVIFSKVGYHVWSGCLDRSASERAQMKRMMVIGIWTVAASDLSDIVIHRAMCLLQKGSNNHDTTYWACSFMHDLVRVCKDHYGKQCWGIGLRLGFQSCFFFPKFQEFVYWPYSSSL